MTQDTTHQAAGAGFVEFFAVEGRPREVSETPGSRPFGGLTYRYHLARPNEFWEDKGTHPVIPETGPSHRVLLDQLADVYLPDCLQHPFLPAEEIRRRQFERIRELVDHAYRTVPFYAEKYRAVGYRPGHLLSWEDFELLPVVTKDELIAAGPRALRRGCKSEFSTRTTGSSGKTLLITVNREAILLDTLQGVRQFWHQSGLKYSRDHLAAMIYTVPWWFPDVEGEFPTAFISTLIRPEVVAKILDEVKPHVISCYPTNLKALLPFCDTFDRSNLYLVVVHSEGSSAAERREWSRQLGVPVLDEYSSEEATRMALEFPCGHYHVCEDSVYLEVLDQKTRQPCPDGTTGLAVITNLLNEDMPFIRYVQGDYVTRPRTPGQCLFGWSQLSRIDGRVNDSFVDGGGREIPAGTILDVIYRWMFQTGVHVKEFELVQAAPDRVRAILQIDGAVPGGEQAFLETLAELLGVCLGHRVHVDATIARTFPPRQGKKRPIRRDFNPTDLVGQAAMTPP